MGITGLWPILDPISQRVNFAEYCLKYGFLPKYLSTRVFQLGVDASVLLDGYSAGSITYSCYQHHTTVDSSLTQLFTILCQLSYAPVHCTFVYDGDERPSHKRGTRVITAAPPLLYQKSKAAVKAFGFDVVDARGDAEAELAVMNQKGIVDAILTRDGDVFPLGAQCVLKVVPKECTNLKLTVDVYYADIIEEELKLTQGGLILYSLLAGNDMDKGGVDGIGPVIALALAQSGFGNSLIADCRPLNSLQRRSYLTNLKMKLSDEKLLTSDLPSDHALNWFLSPPTSWSGRDPARTFDTTPRIHHLPGIAIFCTTHIGWSSEMTLTRFREKLWRGVIIRILCSPLLFYSKADGRLLAPDSRKAFITDKQGRPFPYTNTTTLQGCNPPDLTMKQAGDLVQVTFDVTDFSELTLLWISRSETLKVYVPFAIIAAATGQHNSVPNFLRFLGAPQAPIKHRQPARAAHNIPSASTSSTVPVPAPSGSKPDDSDIEITEPYSVHPRSTSSDDIEIVKVTKVCK